MGKVRKRVVWLGVWVVVASLLFCVGRPLNVLLIAWIGLLPLALDAIPG